MVRRAQAAGIRWSSGGAGVVVQRRIWCPASMEACSSGNDGGGGYGVGSTGGSGGSGSGGSVWRSDGDGSKWRGRTTIAANRRRQWRRWKQTVVAAETPREDREVRDGGGGRRCAWAVAAVESDQGRRGHAWATAVRVSNDGAPALRDEADIDGVKIAMRLEEIGSGRTRTNGESLRSANNSRSRLAPSGGARSCPVSRPAGNKKLRIFASLGRGTAGNGDSPPRLQP
ncbi:hypothetical protein Syun_011486 [Stephania yunnanensis]|uniref:Uncharacterized protein n=1 Tax=Stephania yunnanensis TaxID=152371 RepID=A0AAP0JXM7_9MAGN